MKINVTHPDILRIEYRPGPEDKGYTGCLWADFDIDLAKDTLTITGDCGTYSYGYWSVGPGGFLKFLCGLHEDYLLGKLCGKETCVLMDETREGLREYLAENDMDEDEIDEAMQDLEERIEETDVSRDRELATWILEKWNQENGLDIDCIWEQLVTDYTPWEKRIVRIFVEHIQPKIREIVKAGEQLEDQQG